MRVKALMLSATQWSAASRSNTDPVNSLVQAASSAAYLSAARAIMADKFIEEWHPKLKEFAATVAAQNDACVRSLRRAIAPKRAKEE